MKTFPSILATVAVTALCATAFAAETPGVLTDYIPAGTLLQGVAVQPTFEKELGPILAEVEKKFQALSEEKKKEMLAKRNPDRALDYMPELWESKDAYDNYVNLWAATKMRPVSKVALGFDKGDGGDVWRVISATVDKSNKTMPLTIGALSYNSKDNTWESNNGVLVAKPMEEDKKFVYGAQKGYAWTLEKDDALSKQLESVRIAKTTDGKFIYVYYSFVAVSKASGRAIAQGGYTLCFPVPSDSAKISTPGKG